MYPLDYDTCSRFSNPDECDAGIGIAGSKCVFKDDKCSAQYNRFGSSNIIKYRLSDPNTTRHRALYQKIRSEMILKGYNKRQAALVIKRRLNILKTKSPNNKKILLDISFVNKFVR